MEKPHFKSLPKTFFVSILNHTTLHMKTKSMLNIENDTNLYLGRCWYYSSSSLDRSSRDLVQLLYFCIAHKVY